MVTAITKWVTAIALCMLTLSGCSTKSVDVVVPSGAVVAKVAVPTCDDNLAKSIFGSTQRPAVLPINQLTAADKEDYEKVSKAYIETIKILTIYAVALERDRSESQLQCKAIRDQVDTLNTKTPVLPVTK